MFWPIFLRPKRNESLRDCWFLCHIFLQLSHRLPIPAFQHSPINPLRSQQHAFYWRQKECKQLLSKSLCKAVLTHQYLLHTGPELLKKGKRTDASNAFQRKDVPTTNIHQRLKALREMKIFDVWTEPSIFSSYKWTKLNRCFAMFGLGSIGKLRVGRASCELGSKFPESSIVHLLEGSLRATHSWLQWFFGTIRKHRGALVFSNQFQNKLQWPRIHNWEAFPIVTQMASWWGAQIQQQVGPC